MMYVRRNFAPLLLTIVGIALLAGGVLLVAERNDDQDAARDRGHGDRPAMTRHGDQAMPGTRAGRLVLGVQIDDDLRVTSVTPGGAGANAGIREGDRIERVGSERVRSRDELLAALADVSPGETADLRVQRDGKSVTLQVTHAAGAASFAEWLRSHMQNQGSPQGGQGQQGHGQMPGMLPGMPGIPGIQPGQPSQPGQGTSPGFSPELLQQFLTPEVLARLAALLGGQGGSLLPQTAPAQPAPSVQPQGTMPQGMPGGGQGAAPNRGATAGLRVYSGRVEAVTPTSIRLTGELGAITLTVDAGTVQVGQAAVGGFASVAATPQNVARYVLAQ